MELLSILILSIIILALLGVIIAFSPTLILTEIAILTRSKKPFVHTVFLIFGIAASVTAFSIVTLLFIDPAKTIELPSTKQVLREIPLVDIIVGILLVITGIRLLKPLPKDYEKSKKTSYVFNSKTLFLLGFIKMSTSLSSLAAILFASRLIQTYYSEETAQYLAVIWLICISVLPFVLLVGAKQYRPQMFTKIQAASDRVTTFDWRRITAGCVLLASIFFLAIGLKNI